MDRVQELAEELISLWIVRAVSVEEAIGVAARLLELRAASIASTSRRLIVFGETCQDTTNSQNVWCSTCPICGDSKRKKGSSSTAPTATSTALFRSTGSFFPTKVPFLPQAMQRS